MLTLNQISLFLTRGKKWNIGRGWMIGKYGISFILCSRREGLSIFLASFYWLDCKNICPSSADWFVYSLISTQAIISQPQNSSTVIHQPWTEGLHCHLHLHDPLQTIFGKGRNTEEEVSSLCTEPKYAEMLMYVLYTVSVFYML